MNETTVSSVSVLICTYNRAALLRDTLAALQLMERPDRCDVEIVVVDNNSTDETPAIVASAADGGRFPVVYLRERQQGKSFALNAGLAAATGDILALTDDDVLPSVHWLSRMVATFRAHDVTFVFGKVLPRWTSAPPPELLTPQAQDIWGPLAIVDYGDEAAHYRPESTGQRLPVGANLAFRRGLLLAIGGWRTDLGKVNNTLISGEDHEIFMRMRRLGHYAGYYDPELTVRHLVPATRLTRRYFRQWFYWHGKTQALMLEDLYPELDMANVPRMGGVPRFACRQAFGQWRRWCATRTGDTLVALIEELRLLQYAGLFVECWRRRKQRVRAATVAARRIPAVFALAVGLLLGFSGTTHADAPVRLTFNNGRVSVVAHGVTVQQILVEWARVGRTQIDNADAASGAPLEIELTDVSEQEALTILLRSTGGFVATGSRAGAHTSRFIRILIVRSSTETGDRFASTPTHTVRATSTEPSVRAQQQAQPIYAPSGGRRLIGPDGIPVPDDQEDAPRP